LKILFPFFIPLRMAFALLANESHSHIQWNNLPFFSSRITLDKKMTAFVHIIRIRLGSHIDGIGKQYRLWFFHPSGDQIQFLQWIYFLNLRLFTWRVYSIFLTSSWNFRNLCVEISWLSRNEFLGAMSIVFCLVCVQQSCSRAGKTFTKVSSGL
jgi:hypothetical protein